MGAKWRADGCQLVALALALALAATGISGMAVSLSASSLGSSQTDVGSRSDRNTRLYNYM
jgi:hypothetical protein